MILAPFILTAQESKKRSSLLPEQLNKLLLTESMITRFYVDSVNEVKMVEEGIKAMLKQLDPHSTYSEPKEVKSLMESMRGNFDGGHCLFAGVVPDGYYHFVEQFEGSLGY